MTSPARRPLLRRALRPGVLVVVAALLAAGCGGDDDASAGPTTTAADTTTTTTEATATTTEDTPPPAEEPTPDEEGPEATEPEGPETPPTADPLAARLTPAAELGEGYAPDETVGDGSWSGETCPGQDPTTPPVDQASQALTGGPPEAPITLSEAVLAFADPAEASAFVDEVVDGFTSCQDGIDQEPVAGAGEEAVTLTADLEGASSTATLVRVGPRVALIIALIPPDGTSPVTPELLAAVGGRLT